MEDKNKPRETFPASQQLFQARSPSLTAKRVAQLHTFLSASAFSSALAVGLWLHHKRIVKNQYYRWPDEWFPSVSATIGDWFPERNLFQLLIALTSGPRFLLVLFAYLAHRSSLPSSFLPSLLAGMAVLRTLACGGWVFVTSSDHGDAHDVAMVLYIVLNLPYMILATVLTPSDSPAKSPRRYLGTAFFATLVPLVYFYLQHKAHRVSGAYSIYALFEWSLIVLDISFDSLSILDFSPSLSTTDTGKASREIVFNVAIQPLSQLPPAENTGAVSKTLAKVEMATSGVREFAAEAYMSFAFWTLIVGLGPMIFYNAVWAMGMSGDEVLLLCTLSPILLSIPPFLPLFAHPAMGNLGLLVGLAARYAEDNEGDGMRRLRVTAAGLGLATLGQVAGWWRVKGEKGRVEAKASTFLTGLVFSVLVKFANHSLNPLWPFMRSDSEGNPRYDNGGWNLLGLSLAVLAYVDLAVRRSRVTPTPAQPESKSFDAKVAATTGFATLFFLLHYLYTDSGTIIAWTFAGYPHHGPSAFPGGILTLFFLALGLVLPSFIPSSVLTNKTTYTLACAAASALYTLDGWAGYLPGALLGTYSLSIFPSFLRSLLSSTSSPLGLGLSFGFAFLLYAALELASTIPVAYAFVPGGNILRERTDLVLAVVLSGIGVGLLPLSSSSAPFTTSLASNRALRKRLATFSTLVLVAAAGVVFYRSTGGGTFPGAVDGPYNPAERLVTAGIWTVHFGLDGRMWESQRRMAHLFLDAEIDVVGLLETDVHRIVGGNRDLTQYISYALKMPYVDLGPSPSKNTWGAALISKYPILRSTHHLLPSPNGELAPAIFATLDVYGTEVDVVVAHNGQEEDPLDRELQSKELARLMSERWPRPTVFLGYLVTTPHAERPAPYEYIMEDGRMLDVAPNDLDRWCQYIAYRGVHRVAYARLQRGADPSVTDSEIQVAKFIVPYSNATISPFTLAAHKAEAAASSSDDENSTPSQRTPIPLESYASHLAQSAAPLSSSDDTTVWTPERYFSPSLRFSEDKFGGKGTRGHYFIVLTGEKGPYGQNGFMDKDEKEVIRLEEMRRLAGDLEGCPVQ
ncbi:hypothetical protein JCM8547_007472 [Rhodosporidiobolus lusitaniae]